MAQPSWLQFWCIKVANASGGSHVRLHAGHKCNVTCLAPHWQLLHWNALGLLQSAHVRFPSAVPASGWKHLHGVEGFMYNLHVSMTYSAHIISRQSRTSTTWVLPCQLHMTSASTSQTAHCEQIAWLCCSPATAVVTLACRVAAPTNQI
jgi:hypothetical protein